MIENRAQSKWGCLATDLDGTLIPLNDQPDNRRDLPILIDKIERDGVPLVYVTGRHLDLLRQAIRETPLPYPDWAICDVGTSIYRCDRTGKFESLQAYWEHLDGVIASLPLAELRKQLASFAELRLQEPEKQGWFKLSFYADARRLDAVTEILRTNMNRLKAPWCIIPSVDPFTGDGLIDLLPEGASKAGALAWWAKQENTAPETIVFAGDSGNDEAALTAGYRAILVGNASRDLADRVRLAHQQKGWKNRLHLAAAKGTSGVLEGYRWFQAFRH